MTTRARHAAPSSSAMIAAARSTDAALARRVGAAAHARARCERPARDLAARRALRRPGRRRCATTSRECGAHPPRACRSRSSGCSCSRPQLDAATLRPALRGLLRRRRAGDQGRSRGARTTTSRPSSTSCATASTRRSASSLHFGLTSEDVNNLSYALMLRDAVREVWRPAAEELRRARVSALARDDARRAAALAHARPAGDADDVRQGARGVRRALAPPARRSSTARSTAASSTARSARTARSSSPTPTATGRASRARSSSRSA